MNENVEGVSTPTDDAPPAGSTEQELLDAVMRNSPMMDEVIDAPPPPAEDLEEVVPDESEEYEETAEEEAVSEGEEEVLETDEEEVGEDDESTQEPTVYTLDDLDDFEIAVKIDGEEASVPISELVKGYTTEQSLSRKGRELGEARKELEAERVNRLEEIDQIGQATAAMLYKAEQDQAKVFKGLEERIEKARADGDTYEVNELKDKREQVQKRYWDARRQREGLQEAIKQQQEKHAEEVWNKQLEDFSERIPEFIPDFSEELAKDIRDFAIDEGIAPEILDQITDPAIVKFVNDYRVLKQGVKKGATKRKAVPAKKAIPVKKVKPAVERQQRAEASARDRAFSDDATDEDHMEFLKSYASRSLNL